MERFLTFRKQQNKKRNIEGREISYELTSTDEEFE